MPTETVTVAFVNEPKPGKSFGSIKSEAGIYYSVKPDQLGLFSPGGTYEIEFGFDKTNTYRNFKRIIGAAPDNKSVVKNGHTQAVEMAAMGFVGRWLEGAGNSGADFPDVNRLAEMVSAAKNAWEIAFAVKKPRGELDDEIPF